MIPASIVRALRDPAPVEGDFTPTTFCPAATKAWFAVHYLRFVSSDFPKHQFTDRFYRQLMHTFGHIAHFDKLGFWTEFFTTAAGKVEFLAQTVQWPCHGQPAHTWCDVERAIIRRLRQTDLLGIYRQKLRHDREAAERAEFARLKAKYDGEQPAVDRGVLRTVLAPSATLGARRTGARGGAAEQLALGLG